MRTIWNNGIRRYDRMNVKEVRGKENTRNCMNYLKTIGIGGSDNGGNEQRGKWKSLDFKKIVKP
jgi:hypothetical protein